VNKMGYVNIDYLSQEYSRIRSYILDINVKANKTNLATYLSNLPDNKIEEKCKLLEEAELEIKDALYKLYQIYNDNTFDKKYIRYLGEKGTVVTWRLDNMDVGAVTIYITSKSDAWETYKVDDSIIIKLKRDWHEPHNEELKTIEKEWIMQYINAFIEKLNEIKDKYTIEYTA